jgi:hypothetical protein
MTHNGCCYKSFAFRSACNCLGSNTSAPKPYTPKTYGKVERFIQTGLREWAFAFAYEKSGQRKQQLPTWLLSRRSWLGFAFWAVFGLAFCAGFWLVLPPRLYRGPPRYLSGLWEPTVPSPSLTEASRRAWSCADDGWSARTANGCARIRARALSAPGPVRVASAPRAAGVHMGRPPKLTPAQRREAIARRDNGETLTDIARTFAVSHTTIGRLTAAHSPNFCLCC